MKAPLFGGIVLALLIPAAAAQGRKSQPVGLVLGSGATLHRGAATAPVKPGEVLFAGDTLKSGATPVSFLFCPERYSAALPPGAEAAFQESAVQMKSGALASRKPAASCFLPEVQKLSVASQQHYGVMITRAGSQPPPKTSFGERVATLPADKQTQLKSELAAAQSGDPAFHIVRAAALERAALWFDAGEAYRQAGEQYPEAAWIKLKITEMENMLLKEQTR
jgi:hypothetical protein